MVPPPAPGGGQGVGRPSGAGALRARRVSGYAKRAKTTLSAAPQHPTPNAQRLPPLTFKVTKLEVTPAAVTLADGNDARRLIVTGRTADGLRIDLSAKAKVTPVAPNVDVDADGYVHPVKTGRTTLRVAAEGRTVTVPVVVKSTVVPKVSFVRDVMPIMSKAGCNAGTCHGAAKGKNGFKLSLRGYDPEFDYEALINDLSGRRFNRAAPEQSLMLLKPTQGVPHQGGQTIEPSSRYYNVLRNWIAQGVRSDAKTTRRAERLEVLPANPQMELPGMRQRLQVIAHFPDGSAKDVTREAVFTSSVTEVATVDPTGDVSALRRGETAILVRYEGAYAVDNILVMGDRRGFQWTKVPEYNYIDTLVDRKLQRVKTLPSPACTDAEFIRRASLDLVGLPPTPEQVRGFLADKTPARDKRAKLVDQLIASPAFADQWTNKWADLLQVNRKYLGDKGIWNLRNWIHQSVAENKPYDRMVRELVTASGAGYEHPAASYYRVANKDGAIDPGVLTENMTQLFLGVRFNCNKCHDHPFEKWTQTQYYQFGAFFAQVGMKPGDDGDATIYDTGKGEFTNIRTNQVAPPKTPVGSAPLTGGKSRREALAEWLTSPRNPYFAKSMANRTFSYFLGRGIIDPVDDIRSSNPPSNPELLDALTADFLKSGFDVKHLMRVICTSRVYQQSIATNRWNVDDTTNFAHAIPRRLSAEQLMDAISVATGVPQRFAGMPVGTTAAQLPDTQVEMKFLDLFGRPARESPCECERNTTTVSLGQALNLVNGPTIADGIIAPEGRISRLLAAKTPTPKLIEEIYLAALCRLPTATEAKQALAYMQKAGSPAEGAQDLMWALINTPAFLFNR